MDFFVMLDHKTDYTLTKCLLWGVSIQHVFCCKYAFQNKKYINAVKHLFLGCVEAIPLVGQIISVAERLFFDVKNKKKLDRDFANVAKLRAEILPNSTIHIPPSINEKSWAFQQHSSQKDVPKIGPPTIVPITQPSPKNFVGLAVLKKRQKEHLHTLQEWANQGQWQHLQTHTSHPDSGFDWWMFPVNRASASYGDAYHIGLDDVEILKKDPEFMQNYRDGVVLVAESWGWDLISHKDVSDEKKYWANYPVRLGKMLQSLTVFQQKDLRDSLIQCVQKANILSTLEEWILLYLNPTPP